MCTFPCIQSYQAAFFQASDEVNADQTDLRHASEGLTADQAALYLVGISKLMYCICIRDLFHQLDLRTARTWGL